MVTVTQHIVSIILRTLVLLGGFVMWEKIEAVLNQKKLTQYQLAKKMGVSVSTITELKMGRINKPSFELMCKIADALEVSLDEFRERK